MQQISITVNGKQHNVNEGISLNGLLRLLNINSDRVAVEHNMEIVSKGDFNNIILKEDDILEIITFVGGGI